MINRFLLLSSITFLFAGSSTAMDDYKVPYLSSSIQVDGQLNEECYQKHSPLNQFVIAGSGGKEASSTMAWLFWNEEQLLFAFSCKDSTPVSAPPTSDEKGVNKQDRGEVFLWNGDPKATYYCFEVAPLDALHDYNARFYRKIDDTWSPEGAWERKSAVTADGYNFEIKFSRESIESMGFKLKAGEHFRLGIFRADYDKENSTPTWISWIDREGKPDFHVEESFGKAELMQKKE